MRVLKKILFVILILTVVGFLAGAAGLFGLYHWASRDLPDIRAITDYNPPLATTVYDRNGEPLGYVFEERRFMVGLDEMSPYVRMAFLAAEDSDFYKHEGVDIMAIVRAMIKNIQAGHVVQGGSTITQQVIKELLLTNERSYERKLKEAILAYRLERHLTKDEILTIYLNQIFLGARAYGVEAAARNYFGKHASDLTLAQAALLAGLPKAPDRYSPYNNPDLAKQRQKYVLDRLRELNWISQKQYDQALDEPLEYSMMEDPTWKLGAYYFEEVKRRLVEMYGDQAVRKGGLHVYTALDPEHQKPAEEAVREGLIASTKRRGWQGPISRITPVGFEIFLEENAVPDEDLVPGEWIKVLVVDVSAGGAKVRFGSHTGRMDVSTMAWAREPNPELAPEAVPDVRDARRVLNKWDVVWASILTRPDENGQGEWTLALEQAPDVQGALMSMDPRTGEVLAMVGGYDFHRSQYNRATQARRQPGSAFKPIVYSAAIDNGLTAASVILDAPIVNYNEATNERWKPENYEQVFYGPTLLRTALVKSRNLVTIRVAQRIGMQPIVERARALGLTGEFPPYLSISLGAQAVSLYELCRAYSAFARDGSYIQPRMIMRVTDAWGNEIYNCPPESVPAMSPQTAFIMASLMKQVITGGTGVRASVLNRPLAGKTGTTNDEQDAWFMGFSPYLLTGVYVGFDQLTPMGKYETGARAALPIWINYRRAVEDNYEVQDFPQPPGVVMVNIDAKKGLLAAPDADESYFLPFKAGTQPTQYAQPGSTVMPGDGSSETGIDLFKQTF